MAKKDKLQDETVTTNIDDISGELIRAINKEFGARIAYNLAVDDAPTIVKRWIPSGSKQLDYLIRNASNGGYPEGRVIEISGMPSCGKSHLAYAAAASTQKMGGLVVYIDTENATPVDKLAEMGIDVNRRFVYCETSCTEEVFSIVESTITKAKAILAKNIPLCVIWDSVAATSPKAELDGDYEQNSMGLQARTISKCMRKIVGVIGQHNVTFICLNQLREAIGVMHGDPFVTPGGKSIPFAASIRVRLSSGKQVIDEKSGAVIGSHVICTLKKNKLAPNGRKCEFDIIFGQGIAEDDYIFDEVRSSCVTHGPLAVGNEQCTIEGTGAWKTFLVTNAGGVKIEKKFYKADFGKVAKDPEYKRYIDALIDRAYVVLKSNGVSSSDDGNDVTTDGGDE